PRMRWGIGASAFKFPPRAGRLISPRDYQRTGIGACFYWGNDYDGWAFRDFGASVPLRIFERGFSSCVGDPLTSRHQASLCLRDSGEWLVWCE
ncbi:MAG: hypothetical protein ACREIC_18960, partial [Limisphaerales bacterium]